MRRYPWNTLHKLSAVAMLGGILTAGTEPIQAAKEVPFKARCFGQALLPMQDWWVQPGVVVAEVFGKATHLGYFTGTLTSGSPGQLKLHLEVANGDTLTCDVVSTPTGGDVTITGGTGRFAGASGHWVSTITGPGPNPGSWTEVGEGVISPVGSNKEVPFKAKCFGQALIPMGEWQYHPGEIVAEVFGRATHLGYFTGTLTSVSMGQLTLELEVANGDTLTCHVSSTPTGGNVTITGGTGRYAGASGHWVSTITGLGPDPGSWTEVAEGVISAVGWNKQCD